VTEKPQLEVFEINRDAVSFHLGVPEVDPERAIFMIVLTEDTSSFSRIAILRSGSTSSIAWRQISCHSLVRVSDMTILLVHSKQRTGG
jgi:hypothetical protein